MALRFELVAQPGMIHLAQKKQQRGGPAILGFMVLGRLGENLGTLGRRQLLRGRSQRAGQIPGALAVAAIEHLVQHGGAPGCISAQRTERVLSQIAVRMPKLRHHGACDLGVLDALQLVHGKAARRHIGSVEQFDPVFRILRADRHLLQDHQRGGDQREIFRGGARQQALQPFLGRRGCVAAQIVQGCRAHIDRKGRPNAGPEDVLPFSLRAEPRAHERGPLPTWMESSWRRARRSGTSPAHDAAPGCKSAPPSRGCAPWRR